MSFQGTFLQDISSVPEWSLWEKYTIGLIFVKFWSASQ